MPVGRPLLQIPPLNERDAGLRFAARAALAFAKFAFYQIAQLFDAALDMFFIHARKSQAQGVWLRILEIEMAARNIQHAALAHVNQ